MTYITIFQTNRKNKLNKIYKNFFMKKSLKSSQYVVYDFRPFPYNILRRRIWKKSQMLISTKE